MGLISRAWAIAVATVSVAACAHTSMTSLPSPDAAGQRYQKILVRADFADLGLRQDTEMRFAAKSVAGQYQFVPSTQLFYPGKQYSAEQVDSTLRRYSIDAFLILQPGGTGNRTNYVPPYTTSTCTTASCRQVTTTTAPGTGVTYTKPWAEFSAQLYSVETGESVWFATATSKGNAYADSGDLANSVADKTVEELLTSRLIR